MGGSKTPESVPGSVLEQKLTREGAQLSPNPGRALLEHIVRNGTPGYITEIIWNKESSFFEHQYLLICVDFVAASDASWLRVERMGDLEGSSSPDPAVEEEAGLIMAMAPTPDGLTNNEDRLISSATFDRRAVNLADVSQLILIIHAEATEYSLIQHNCWWLARLVFQILVERYLPDGKKKRKLLNTCLDKHHAHAEALYYSPYRGRVLRRVLLLGTAPVFFITFPVIIVGSAIIFYSTLYALSQTKKQIEKKFDEHLKKKRAG